MTAQHKLLLLTLCLILLQFGCSSTSSVTSTPPPVQTGIGGSSPAALPITPTTPATLSVTSQHDYLLKLLHDNTGCELPCWWNITPGKTSWGDAADQLHYMHLKTGDKPLPDGSTYHGVGGLDWYPNGIFMRLGIYERQSVVRSVSVRAEGYQDKAFFYTLWGRYSPEALARTYGPPERVSTMLFGSEQGIEFYYLALFLPERGVVALYKGQASPVSEQGQPYFRVCPEWTGTSWLPELQMHVQAPDDNISLDEAAQLDPKLRSLEDVSRTTVKELSAGWANGTQPGCFDTAASLWP